mgnify:CR=1 FL=1
MLNITTRLRLTWTNGVRYLPLLQNLISRELKKRYRQSVLGYLWCVLNPLLVMLIMTVVFSRMFARDIENFPVYLFAGRMMYSFITDCGGAIMHSIVNNGSLMRKTRIPYYVFPLSAFGCSVVNFLFQLVAFALVLLFTRTPVSIHVVAFPAVMLLMFLFSFGFGMLLAILNVFVRDTHYLYAVFLTAWLYLTPLFYPITALSERMQFLIRNFNPAYYFVEMSRNIFLDHVWPGPDMLLRGAIAAAVFLVIGLTAYAKTRKNIILYV